MQKLVLSLGLIIALLGCTNQYPNLILESEVYCPECAQSCQAYFDCLAQFDCNEQDDICASCHRDCVDGTCACDETCALVHECSNYECVEQGNTCEECYAQRGC